MWGVMILPLKGGYSREAISSRISQLMKEGYDQRQAVAISLSQARKAAEKISDPKRRAAIMRKLSKGGRK